MTMKIQKLFAVLLVLLGAHSLSAVAQDNEIITEPLIYKPEKELPEIDLSKIEHEEAYPSRGRAIGIQQFQIVGVGSSQGGWEYPAYNANSTRDNHGGRSLMVVVYQHGYGNTNHGRMGSKSVYESRSRSLCGPIGNVHYCSTGETITGWLYHFDFSGEQSGIVNVSANSTAYPFGYWQDSLYIK